jgi:hypothetical protein
MISFMVINSRAKHWIEFTEIFNKTGWFNCTHSTVQYGAHLQYQSELFVPLHWWFMVTIISLFPEPEQQQHGQGSSSDAGQKAGPSGSGWASETAIILGANSGGQEWTFCSMRDGGRGGGSGWNRCRDGWLHITGIANASIAVLCTF